MDNTTHASNIKDDDEVNTNNAAKIPKVNMRFDGSSWKNQALSPNNISERKNIEKPPLPPEYNKASPKSTGSNDDTDREFVYGDNAENCFDDEETVDEEEAADDGEGDADELNDLAKESEMPLDDLIALYYSKQDSDGTEYNSNEENRKLNSIENKDDANYSDDNEDLTRQLRSSSSFLSPNHHQSGDEDEDGDYVPPTADDWKKLPRVGEKYQTDNIPDTKHQSPDYDLAEDQLVWNPACLEEEKVKSYLKLIGEGQSDGNLLPVPTGSHLRDNEDALFLLTQCNSDVDEAVKKFRQRPPNLANDLTVWTEEECRKFEHGLTAYGKDFHLIHLNSVKNKSIGEIVKFYYIWKKTERYDLFNAKTRLGKKKDTMHPGVTDYMERLLDETEHSISSQHGTHNHSSNPPYPLPLTHTAALQQHLAEARASRHQNRPPNAYDSDAPSLDYSVINGLVDGDYPDEIDMLDGIVPTFTPNPSYPPAPFVPIDPAVNPGYSDPNQFAPTGSINHHPELVSISPFPTNQNNNSHVVASSNHVHPTIQSADLASDRVATVPADVLSSINELETAYRHASSNNEATAFPSLIANLSNDPPTSIDSPSEREPNIVNLKRFQSPAGDVLNKKAKSEVASSVDHARSSLVSVSRDCPETLSSAPRTEQNSSVQSDATETPTVGRC